MHHYPFNIGDYRKDTGYLSITEHGIYRLLIDTYYLTELPLSLDHRELCRLHCIRSEDERMALENILADFFTKTESGYIHTGCQKVLSKIYEKSEKARQSAERKWQIERAKKSERMKEECERNANAYETDANALKSDAPDMLPITHNPIPNTQHPTPSCIEPAKAVSIKQQKSTLSKNDLVTIGFDAQLAEDYLTLRKAKKLPLTKTALINIVHAGAEVGLNPNQTLTYCINSSWAGFKKEWYLKDNQAGQRVSVISDFLRDPDFDF